MQLIPGVSKKVSAFINNRTKVFCLIFILFSVLNTAYPNSDFETKIVQNPFKNPERDILF